MLIEGDLKYGDLDIAKFINYLMVDGKKSTARAIVYDCFEIVKNETKQDPRHIFNKALKNVQPLLEVRGRRVGGANYQIPYQVRGKRRFALGCRWLIDAANKRKGKTMAAKLAIEVIDAMNNEGAAVKKREDVHRMAESNKAFAHFAR
jgi:small subunit ribosomal protein S7